MDPDVKLNRIAWESASEKYVREYQDLLLQATRHTSLFERELDLLRPLLSSSPVVVHLLSGHGLDDIDLVAAGAQSVVGVDFSHVLRCHPGSWARKTFSAPHRSLEPFAAAGLPRPPLPTGVFAHVLL